MSSAPRAQAMYCSASSRGCPSSPGASGVAFTWRDGRRRAGFPPSPAASFHQNSVVSVMVVSCLLHGLSWGGQYSRDACRRGRNVCRIFTKIGRRGGLGDPFCQQSLRHDPPERLELRELTTADAPSFSNCSTTATSTAGSAIAGCVPGRCRELHPAGPAVSYARHGHGLYLVARRSDGARLGICGLIKRDTLPCEDIGYAFRRPGADRAMPWKRRGRR